MQSASKFVATVEPYWLPLELICPFSGVQSSEEINTLLITRKVVCSGCLGGSKSVDVKLCGYKRGDIWQVNSVLRL